MPCNSRALPGETSRVHACTRTALLCSARCLFNYWACHVAQYRCKSRLPQVHTNLFHELSKASQNRYTTDSIKSPLLVRETRLMCDAVVEGIKTCYARYRPFEASAMSKMYTLSYARRLVIPVLHHVPMGLNMSSR